jgi:pimeloyl-ACP methyl ester carboxylesterase
METIKSVDGTPIAYHRSGAGPPLILVPGAGAANPVAWPIVTALQDHFTVIAVDRRGHGGSGDAPTYAIEREFEDIAALVDSFGEPADLLGHSFGGLCALEAALLTPNIQRLILYESLSLSLPESPLYPAGFFDRLDALLAADDREAVLVAHYRESVGMRPAEFERMKSSPAWPARLAAAATLPRELRAEDGYRFDAQRFKDLHTPTLLLSGGDSPDFIKRGSDVVAAALPESRVAVMPGQEHIAMYTAPELFLDEVLAFLNGPG